jgi:hypothetical protein
MAYTPDQGTCQRQSDEAQTAKHWLRMPAEPRMGNAQLRILLLVAYQQQGSALHSHPLSLNLA